MGLCLELSIAAINSSRVAVAKAEATEKELIKRLNEPVHINFR